MGGQNALKMHSYKDQNQALTEYMEVINISRILTFVGRVNDRGRWAIVKHCGVASTLDRIGVNNVD